MNKLDISTNSQESLLEKLDVSLKTDAETILCKYCKRTRTNGIRCIGICVSENEY